MFMRAWGRGCPAATEWREDEQRGTGSPTQRHVVARWLGLASRSVRVPSAPRLNPEGRKAPRYSPSLDLARRYELASIRTPLGGFVGIDFHVSARASAARWVATCLVGAVSAIISSAACTANRGTATQPVPRTATHAEPASPSSPPPPASSAPSSRPPPPSRSAGCMAIVQRDTQRPVRPRSGCGACVKQWEAEDAAFQPTSVDVCDRCLSAADCGAGGECVMAMGAERAPQRLCTRQASCNGTWVAQGDQAFCQAADSSSDGGPYPP